MFFGTILASPKGYRTPAMLFFMYRVLTFIFFTFISAKITTRPGQVGACNGYILEGEELDILLNTRQDLRLSEETRPEGL